MVQQCSHAKDETCTRATACTGERAIEGLERQLAAVEGKLKDAEARAKTAADASAEKDAMIK